MSVEESRWSARHDAEPAARLPAVLVAEDNPHDREMLGEALREFGFANEIDLVCDGEDALDYLFRRKGYALRRPGNPALILLDIRMPKVDGLEVLLHIKAEPALRGIPVLILTSSPQDRDLVAAYQVGSNAYLVKPLQLGAFVAALRSLGLHWGVVARRSGAAAG